jgi:hypothetical protein
MLAWVQLGTPPPSRAFLAAVLIVSGVAVVATRTIALTDAARRSLRE